MLLNLAESYIFYFDKVLFAIFPFTKNFDFSGRVFFCIFLIIVLQALAVIFEAIAKRR